MIRVQTSLPLIQHLSTYQVDGATVESVLFEGGRLSYPGRRELEHILGVVEPYTLELEARTISSLPLSIQASIRYLSAVATESHHGLDLTLDLLWTSHRTFMQEKNEVALDRLVAALVTINDFQQIKVDADDLSSQMVIRAGESLIKHMHTIGFPPNRQTLEEIFDGADPACIGLGLVEL